MVWPKQNNNKKQNKLVAVKCEILHFGGQNKVKKSVYAVSRPTEINVDKQEVNFYRFIHVRQPCKWLLTANGKNILDKLR